MFLKNVINSDASFKQKCNNLQNFIKYYINLQKGIRDKSIFALTTSESKDLLELQKELSTEKKLLEEVFSKNVKSFLEKQVLKKKIEFFSKEDFLQAGLNSIFLEEPIRSIWTTGKALFYLPTNNKSRKVKCQIFSLIPTSVCIKFENISSKKILISKLSTKKIELDIIQNSELETVSEISIESEKRWISSILTNQGNDIPLGVWIKSIEIID